MMTTNIVLKKTISVVDGNPLVNVILQAVPPPTPALLYDETSFVWSGSDLVAWNNIGSVSDSAWHMTSVTDGPTKSSINGLDAVYLHPSRIQQAPSTVKLSPWTGTMFIVLSPDIYDTGRTLFANVSTLGTHYQVVANHSPAWRWRQTYTDGINPQVNTDAFVGPPVSSGTHVFWGSYNGVNVQAGINADVGTPVASANTGDFRRFTIGGTTAFHFRGDVGEIRVYDVILTQTQHDAILSELRTKWGTN